MSLSHLSFQDFGCCRLSARDDGDAAVVILSGELDLAASTGVSGVLHDLIEHQDRGDVVVDLAEVTFIDSSGINAILTAAKQVRGRQGRFTIRRPSPSVRRVLDLLGLDTILDIEAERLTSTN